MPSFFLRRVLIAVTLQFVFMPFQVGQAASSPELMPVLQAASTQEPLPVLQAGHRISKVALRPDGQVAATGGEEGAIKFWDRRTGFLIRTVAVHSGRISTLAFSADGTRIVSGGEDGRIAVVDSSTGRIINSFVVTRGVVAHAVFNGRGDWIAACFSGVDGKPKPSDNAVDIKIFDLAGRLLKTLVGHTRAVTTLDFSNVDTLVSASSDKTVKVWSVASGQPITTLPVYANDGFIDISPDGETVSVVTYYAKPTRQEFTSYKVSTGEKTYSFRDDQSWGPTAISANGAYFVAASSSAFKVWDVEAQEVVNFVPGKKDFKGIAIDEEGKTIAWGGPTSARFWPSENSASRFEAPILKATTGLAVSNDNRLVAWGAANKIYVWDQASKSLLYTLSGHNDPINEMAFSPDGRTLVSCSSEQVKLWSTADGSWLADLKLPRPSNVLAQTWSGSESVSFSPDGNLLATGELRVTETKPDTYTEALGIRVWDVKSRTLFRSYPLPKFPDVEFDSDGEKDAPFVIRSIAFNRDNRTIAADNGSNQVVLLDVKTGKFRKLDPHRREINSVAFSNDGKYLASASFDRTLRVWETSTGRVIQELKGHTGRVTTTKFSRNGFSLLSGARDRTLRLWDIRSGTTLWTDEKHEQTLSSVAVSVDGNTVFTSSLDGRINIWSLPNKTLTATIIAGSDGTWICYTPDGYYKGRAGERYLAWRVGNDMYSPTRYQSTYERPDVLATRFTASRQNETQTEIPVITPTPSAEKPPSTGERLSSSEVRLRIPKSNASVLLYKHSYAMVIGNSDYVNWESLPGVRRDLAAVSSALKRQGFDVVSFDARGEAIFDVPALNLTRDQFNRQMELFINQFGQDEDSRLLVYYAGHGYTAKLNDERTMGYLVMKDAPQMPAVDLEHPLSSVQLRPFRSSSVNMDEIVTFAKNITSRHALFVFDSCFSGSVFEAFRDGESKAPSYITADVIGPVREFLTAGNELQRVPDNSKFREAFVRGIEGAADTSDRDNPKDGYVLATELHQYIKRELDKRGEKQTPSFRKIPMSELSRGDFVFPYK
jgi:WD40 repeat protein